MNIKICLQPYSSRNNYPSVRIKINDIKLFDDVVYTENFTFTKEIENLKDINFLTIEHYNKSNKDTISDGDKIIEDKAIELKSIIIDRYKVPEVILYSNKFYPQYPKNIADAPEYITNNLYFGYNGIYYFSFEKDISVWYYKMLLLKEKLANENNQKVVTLPNGEVVETFEFAGKDMKANDASSLSINELYTLIQNES